MKYRFVASMIWAVLHSQAVWAIDSPGQSPSDVAPKVATQAELEGAKNRGVSVGVVIGSIFPFVTGAFTVGIESGAEKMGMIHPELLDSFASFSAGSVIGGLTICAVSIASLGRASPTK